jgi:ATP-binding cassette subfamily B protein
MVQAYVMSGMAALLGLVGNVSVILRQKADFAASAPIYEIEPEPECRERLPGHWAELAARNVALNYRFEDSETPALRGIDLTLLRGRHYALVGANGSGKSTLLKLLAGLLTPDQGKLFVDGREVGFAALRAASTLIPQHPELLEGTLEHNLLIGSANGEAAAEVSRSAVATALLARLAVTLDSHVNEGGVNWSGGQRQRIALARGMMSAAGSSLVLVDEPTSSIDPADELVTLREIRAEFRSQCLIVSVHNLDLVTNFDELLVLEDGRLVDAGPPDLVLSRCSFFPPVSQSPTCPTIYATPLDAAAAPLEKPAPDGRGPLASGAL